MTGLPRRRDAPESGDHVEIRLSTLLGGGQGQIPDQLAPLADALLAAEKPRSVLVWLGRSPAAQLLAQLAAQPDPLTHAVLDSLPPSRAAHFVRRMLMDAGRNTAMLTLAADLPASVLADLLGIHEVTATRWAHRTKRDWHTSLAQRRIDTNDPTPRIRAERMYWVVA